MRILIRLIVLVCLAGYLSANGNEPRETSEMSKSEQCFSIQELRALAGKDKWQPYTGNPVISPGTKDEWDGWAIGSMSILKVGEEYHLYYEGWGLGTIQIGHATSADGVHWTKDPGNPVLPRNEEGWDSGGTWDTFVLYEDGIFKMWYGATPRGGARGKFHWGYADSEDGTNFVKKGQISDFPHAEVEDDHVVHDMESGRYYMYYWDRDYEPMGLFRAESPNETDFDFKNAAKIKIERLKYPMMYKFTHVFKENGKWYMYFAEFIRPRCKDCRTGYATSTDGLHWEAQNIDLIVGQDAEILKVEDDLYLMYYGPDGYFDGEGCDIRLAVYAGRLDDLRARE